MAVINIDETIKKLLKNYQKHVEIVISRDKKRIASEKERLANEFKRLAKEFERLANKKEHLADEKGLQLAKVENETIKNLIEADEKSLQEAEQSLEFLKLVILDPRKYLYRETDMMYTTLSDGRSVYSKLQGIMKYKYDKGVSLLFLLSKMIAAHMRNPYKTKNSTWIFYNGLTNDYEAEQILKINKLISLMDTNDFIRVFKEMMPEHKFAVLLHQNQK